MNLQTEMALQNPNGNNRKRDIAKNILRKYLNSKENPYKLPDGQSKLPQRKENQTSPNSLLETLEEGK